MRALVKDEVKEIQVTTVTLGHDYTDKFGMKLYIFHCIRCGSPIIQFKGNIIDILPGIVPASLPLILQCNNSRCKHKYMFRDIATVDR